MSKVVMLVPWIRRIGVEPGKNIRVSSDQLVIFDFTNAFLTETSVVSPPLHRLGTTSWSLSPKEPNTKMWPILEQNIAEVICLGLDELHNGCRFIKDIYIYIYTYIHT